MKILIIEDEKTTHTLLERILVSQLGATVFHAYNGTDGLLKCYAEKPDLVLCDYLMPELSGYEVLKAIRSNPDTATTPVVIMTAENEREPVIELLTLKPNDFLLKPINIATLSERVRKIIEKSA